MRKEAILLTILIVMLSCEQTQNNQNNTSVDSVTTDVELIQDKDLYSTTLDSEETDIPDLTETDILDSTETALGLGVVSINFDDKTTLQFYSEPNDKEPKRIIQFFNDQTINSWNIRDLDKNKEWLKPEILWLDYSQFVFRCVTNEENWLKIIVNNETGETLWLKKSNLTIFRDWEDYLKGMFGVERLTEQKIRKLPTDNSDAIIYQGQDCFQVKSMQGDWIEIFTADYCDKGYTDSKTKIKSGWIKWRQGNKLLINYFTTC